ncbi:hypothetical protein SAMN05519103_09157 [Rhizobiales bacterium GAS113]|nr:hypothetical protein SAMN05519103_09157 [Rhizobiales bacterium GAS113]
MERALRDPARPGFATPRSACASGSDRARQTTSAAPAGHNPAVLRTERTARSSDNAPRTRHVWCFPPSVAPRATHTVNRNPHRPPLRPAGSFLGDFRTPTGARNSSRMRNGGSARLKWESGHSLLPSVVATRDPQRRLRQGWQGLLGANSGPSSTERNRRRAALRHRVDCGDSTKVHGPAPCRSQRVESFTHRSAIKATNGLYIGAWFGIMSHEARRAQL